MWRFIEINHNGKTVLKGRVTVFSAIKRLFDYEETGLTPFEVHNLIVRERNLTNELERLQGGRKHDKH